VRDGEIVCYDGGMDLTVSPLTAGRWPALVARRKPDRPVMRTSLGAPG